MVTLLNVFIIIFAATAIIGLLSLPGWIKIPEWYRKRIFITLIVEVTTAIIFLFYERYDANKILENAKVVPANINWVSWTNESNYRSPKVKIITSDNTYVKEFEVNHTSDGLLEGRINDKTALEVISPSNDLLGSIEAAKLAQYGLFSDLNSNNSEIEGKTNYKYIKWTKNNGRWKRDNNFLGPFEFKIFEENGGTYYLIRNTINNDIVFEGKKEVEDDQTPNNYISEKDRINHFLKHDNNFYLFRIAWADLVGEPNYVHVLNLKMEPLIKSK